MADENVKGAVCNPKLSFSCRMNRDKERTRVEIIKTVFDLLLNELLEVDLDLFVLG